MAVTAGTKAIYAHLSNLQTSANNYKANHCDANYSTVYSGNYSGAKSGNFSSVRSNHVNWYGGCCGYSYGWDGGGADWRCSGAYAYS